MKLFISKFSTIICALCFVHCLLAQESRANDNPSYNFQQGRILFDQKQ